MAELQQTRRERDFYLRLLALGAQSEPEPFLREALSLAVELTNASRGYLEIRDERAGDSDSDWWHAHGCTEVDGIRSLISRGIIAEAIATGQTIVEDRWFKLDSLEVREVAFCLLPRRGAATSPTTRCAT